MISIPRYVVHFVGQGEWSIYDRHKREIVERLRNRRTAREAARRRNAGTPLTAKEMLLPSPPQHDR